MRARDALILGRVSNLPTVWSNTLAGWALAGGPAVMRPAEAVPLLAVLLSSLSLLYVAGMYLNDACDAAIDRRQRPDRPIPAGRVARRTVLLAAAAMIAAALALLAAFGSAAAADGRGGAAFAAGGLLTIAILGYDLNHKGNPFSPVLMGLCRALVYVTAYVAVAPPDGPLAVAALALAAYLVGLTYAAKEEAFDRLGHAWPLLFLAAPFLYALPAAAASLTGAVAFGLFAAVVGLALWRLRRRAAGDVPRAVAVLLAGLCLFDALVIAGAGFPGLALIALALFVLTLVLQRWVPAT